MVAGRAPAASRPKRIGREKPRISTPPNRRLTRKTTLGYECIRFAEEILGIELLPWQKWLLIHALELNLDGTFRFRTVILLVARQNGKSTLMQVLSLWRMYVDGAPLVIGTAQNLDIAELLWQGALDLADDVPELASEIAARNRTNGKKSFTLESGESYKVQAASRRGGRGLSGDLVLLDELREHQSWDAWGAVTKTTMARERAQVWGPSNAGDASSIVLRFLRRQAHLALGDPDGLAELELDAEVEPDETVDADALDDEDTLGIFEWSAPPECGVWDRDAWAQANPSMGHTITEKAIAAAAKTDPEWVFRTEVLCQWTDGTLEGPFPPGTWEDGADPESKVGEGNQIALCVDVSHDRSFAHIAIAGRRADAHIHVGILASRAGTDWVLPWLESDEAPPHCGVAIQTNGAPASSLADEIEAAGIEVIEWKGSDLVRSSGNFYDFVRGGVLKHRPQPILDVAAATAVTRPLADAWWWDRRNSPTDIAPLVAATGAVWVIQPKPTTAKNPQIHEWPDELMEAM